MQNECSWSDEPVPPLSITLKKIWHVRADKTYDVYRPTPMDEGLIIVRTTSGVGIVTLADGRQLRLTAASLVLLDDVQIRHYWCDGPAWHFWWCYIQTDQPLFPLYHILSAPWRRRETADIQTSFRLLSQSDLPSRLLASVLFAAVMHRWRADCSGTHSITPQDKQIQQAIEKMRRNLAPPLSIAELAASVNLSERWFRQIFQKATGQLPRTYYENLRLRHAVELLRLGNISVQKVAEQLGFSSPYHFCRSFKRRYKIPPSLYNSTQSN